MCPSWRRNTLTIKSRLPERRPPAGRSFSTNSLADGIDTSRGLGRERGSAAAGRLRVRILDCEPAAHVVVDEVDLRALEVAQADRIHEQTDAVDLERLVRRRVAFALVNHEAVLEAGTPAALDKDPQAGAHAVFLRPEFVDLFSRRF